MGCQLEAYIGGRKPERFRGFPCLKCISGENVDEAGEREREREERGERERV